MVKDILPQKELLKAEITKIRFALRLSWLPIICERWIVFWFC